MSGEIPTPDALRRRCPRLGSPVTFQYCRLHAGGKLPCWKVFDCWWEIFDVRAHLVESLSAEDFERLCRARPQPKILSLVELIEQARKSGKDDPDAI